MSILVLGLIAFLGYSVYSKGYFTFQPEGKRYQKNSGLVQDYLLSQQPYLVDFGDDELELLSAINKGKRIVPFLVNRLKGYYFLFIMNHLSLSNQSFIPTN